MRKLLCILLLFMGCLLVAGSAAHAEDRGGAATELTVDRASAGQWLCERAANSDLGLPHAPSVAAPQLRPACGSSQAGPARTAVRTPWRCVAAGSMKTTSPFSFTHPVCVTQAVDRYVYRLRRLII